MALDLTSAAMGASLFVAVLMLFGKLAAYAITGSAAILSDAIESVIHIAATGVAGFSLWYARRPATPKHPYGHGKMAFFSAGFEGALIFTAALAIFYTAVQALIVAAELRQLSRGLLITGGLALVNLALGLFLVFVGKSRNSLILVANGQHVFTDMWTSVGVVFGVAIVWATGVAWLDPAVAILVGLNITWSGFGLMRRAFAGLLDEAPPDKTGHLLEYLERARFDGLLTGFHQLRHRQSNDDMWVEVHLLMPGGIMMREAHARVTRVEEGIRTLFHGFNVHVTTHVEPTRHDIAHPTGHPDTRDPYPVEAGAPHPEGLRSHCCPDKELLPKPP